MIVFHGIIAEIRFWTGLLPEAQKVSVFKRLEQSHTATGCVCGANDTSDSEEDPVAISDDRGSAYEAIMGVRHYWEGPSILISIM